MFYVKSPYKPMPTLLIQGSPEYVYGSFNTQVGPTLGNVISNSAVTTTGTLTFQILSGNVPVANSLITVVGCSNSANFNVTNANLISISTTAAGICTVTYAITSTSQPATTADSGQVYIAVPETPDNLSSTIVSGLSSGAGSSMPVASPVGSTSLGRSISVRVNLLATSTTYVSNLTG